MKKLLFALLFLGGINSFSQTNCVCDTAQADTNTIYGKNSFHFDGFNNKTISFGDASILDGGVFSVRIKLRKLTNTQTLNKVIWSKWGNTGNQRSAELIMATNGKLQYRSSPDGSSSLSATSTTMLTSLEWGYDIIITHDKNASGGNAGKIKMYINGVAETLTFSGTHGNIYNSTAPFQIGLESTGTTFDQFNGYVNEFAVTSDVITSTEVTTLYNSGKPLLTDSICDNISLDPKFDNATFSTNWSIPDSSGNGLTGTSALMDTLSRVPTNFNQMKKYLIIALLGQSNQRGDAVVSSLPGVYKEKRADVKIWQGSSFTELITTTTSFPAINSGRFGTYFAKGWNTVSTLGHDVLYVEYSIAGTDMTTWKYGGTNYNAAVKTLDSVICYVENLGYNYDLLINYNQGESDGTTSAKANGYDSLYTRQTDSLKAHYPCLKGYLCTLTRSNCGAGYTYTGTVHNSQISVINTLADPRFIYLDINDLSTGLLHLVNTTYKTAGEREAVKDVYLIKQ